MQKTVLGFSIAMFFALPAFGTPGTWSSADLAEIREKPRISRRGDGVTATFFVTADPRRAYRMLTDHARLPEFMPNMDSCRILKSGSDWAEIEFRSSRGSMILRREFDPPTRITWKLVESSMLKKVEGSWHLDPVEGGTILTYDSEVATRVPVPGFITNSIQQEALQSMIANVRRRIDSDGTWIKPDFKPGSRP